MLSQNGEDGVVAEVLRRIGAPTRWFVEFGVGAGHEGVCLALADLLGWSGLFIEADQHLFDELSRKYSGEPRVVTAQAMVDAANVESLFARAGVPADLDVLSIDVDGNDWWIWRAIVTYRPRLLVIEYNGNLDPASQLVKPYDPDAAWDETCWFGASLGAYERLGAAKGYTLVHTDLRGVNAFFLRDDLLPAFGPVAAPRPRRQLRPQRRPHARRPLHDDLGRPHGRRLRRLTDRRVARPRRRGAWARAR